MYLCVDSFEVAPREDGSEGGSSEEVSYSAHIIQYLLDQCTRAIKFNKLPY